MFRSRNSFSLSLLSRDFKILRIAPDGVRFDVPVADLGCRPIRQSTIIQQMKQLFISRLCWHYELTLVNYSGYTVTANYQT